MTPILDKRRGIIDEEISKFSRQYKYDRQDFPIEVVIGKYAPQGEGEEQTLFIPHYQRALVWKQEMQSRFIESLFLGVPIPPIFVSVMDTDGRLEIIDGSQRIRTISKFISGELKLKKLESLKSLNGIKFKDLSIPRQRKFKLINIRVNVITEEADLSIRADIFDRLNSTGEKLTPSQIRKGAFASSNFYSFILKMSEIPTPFKNLPRKKLIAGEAAELTLRFFVYADVYKEHEHAVAMFLNRYVQKKNDDFDQVQLTSEFTTMLAFVKEHFPSGFNKTSTSKAIPRVRFEAIAVGTHLALKEKHDLVPTYMKWLDSKEFKKETTSDASNNQGRIASRIEFVRDCLLNKTKEEDLTY